MILPQHTLLLYLILALLPFADSALHFKANFEDTVKPFVVHLDSKWVSSLKYKASLAEFPEDIDIDPFQDGPPTDHAATVRDYWANEYSWEDTQEYINSRFHNYITRVSADGQDSTYPHNVDMHFVHHTSPHSDAIPLLFVHGWPGSFLEVDDVLDQLISPPNSSLQAFHVVAPSIPGFGFSPAPVRPGFGYRELGHACNALMKKLGYSKYVIQGGDVGGFSMRYQIHYHPDSVVSALSNFWVAVPTQEDLQRYNRNETTADEDATVEALHKFGQNYWGYGQIHQTRPLRLAYAMSDSPVGMAMWLYDAMLPVTWNKELWTPERVIVWTMMLLIPGPYGGFRIYKEGRANGALTIAGFGDIPYANRPIAISEFPLDIIWYRTPLDWAQRGGDVKYRTLHDRGGHFATLDATDLLLNDIWEFFGDRNLSETSVFFESNGQKTKIKDEL